MLIKTLPVGQLETNCYVVTDEKSLICAVIDPGDESNTILDYLEDNHLKCTHILITHGHYDHTMAVSAVKEATGAEVYMNEKDAHADLQSASLKYNPPAGTHFYKDGDTVDVGGLHFTVLETPGHSAGSVCLICEDAIFSGDTLFQGSCGRTDFPGSDPNAMLSSLKRLYALEGDYEVYPGHMDSTTLSRERAHNYYMRLAAGLE
jgi:hydroxyacylglutathione hydrolase